MDGYPDPVDVAPHGRLRRPGQGLREGPVQAVEDVPAIAEAIFDEVESLDLIECAVVPAPDAWVCGEPSFLRPINLLDGATCCRCYRAGLPSVVGVSGYAD